ncbi:MAG: hypothetical protein MI922_06845, partial [Bacteroidales bacterium]|nr:hypothetical protein [Bacteroidales bacterium]
KAYLALLQLYSYANDDRNGDGGGGFTGILCVEAVTSSLTHDPNKDNFKQAYWVNIDYPNSFVSISKKTKSIERWINWPDKNNPVF